MQIPLTMVRMNCDGVTVEHLNDFNAKFDENMAAMMGDAHPSAQHNPTLPSFLVYISGAFRRSAFYFRKFPLALCAGADPENGKKSMMDMKDLPMEEGAEIKWARCEIKNALLAQITQSFTQSKKRRFAKTGSGQT